ncbi:MAG TPA: tetratricopeptide repeat protein, partial [Bacteroidota bacterium]
QYAAAVKMYQNALKKGPDTDQLATGLYGIVESYYDMEQYEQAVETALVLVTLQPKRETSLIPHGYYRLGQAYAKLGRVNEARAAFEAVDRYDNYDNQSRLESRVEQELQKLSAVN